MDNLHIYQNEAYLIADMIKSRFNSKYDNLELITTLSIDNMLLKGIHLTLIDDYLDKTCVKYVSIKGIYNISDYIDYIFIEIQSMLADIVHEHYYKDAT